MPTCKKCGVKINKGETYCGRHKYQKYKASHRQYQKEWYANPELPEPEKVKRRCLRCDRVFMAEGRFNRICPACAGINEHIVDPERYGVLAL